VQFGRNVRVAGVLTDRFWCVKT